MAAGSHDGMPLPMRFWMQGADEIPRGTWGAMERFVRGGQRQDPGSSLAKKHNRHPAQAERQSTIQGDAPTRRDEKRSTAQAQPHLGRDVRQSEPRATRHATSSKRSREDAGGERMLGKLCVRATWRQLLTVEQNAKKPTLEDFVKGKSIERRQMGADPTIAMGEREPARGGKLMKEALQFARDPRALEKERRRLCENFTSESSRKAKETKRQEVMQLANAVTEGGRPIPLATVTVERVAAALKRAGFKSGPQYLGELRLAHIEAGYELNACLTRCFRLCKKALERDSGPVRRAPEVRAEMVTCFRAKPKKNYGKLLLLPSLAYLMAMAWMLREIELREIRWEHMQLKEDGKLVTLQIRKSKTDQAGMGVRRTLTCCGKEVFDPVCAWRIANKLLNHKQKDEDLMFLTREGKPPSKQEVVNSWKWAAATPCSGRSARRSGAMHYVRSGMNISELAYLGRWKSSVVLTYAEEALEEVAANRGQKSSWSPADKSRVLEDRVPPATPSMPDFKPTEEKPVETVPARAEEHPWSCVIAPPKYLWVVTKGRGTANRPVHLVVRATWAIPLAKWTTACGWTFAERSAEFRFVPKPSLSHKKCRKCLTLRDGRDEDQGGGMLAPAFEV